MNHDSKESCAMLVINDFIKHILSEVWMSHRQLHPIWLLSVLRYRQLLCPHEMRLNCSGGARKENKTFWSKDKMTKKLVITGKTFTAKDRVWLTYRLAITRSFLKSYKKFVLLPQQRNKSICLHLILLLLRSNNRAGCNSRAGWGCWMSSSLSTKAVCSYIHVHRVTTKHVSDRFLFSNININISTVNSYSFRIFARLH